MRSLCRPYSIVICLLGRPYPTMTGVLLRKSGHSVTRHLHIHRGGCECPGRRCRLQAKERDLRRKQPCEYLDLIILASRTIRKSVSVFKPLCGILLGCFEQTWYNLAQKRHPTTVVHSKALPFHPILPLCPKSHTVFTTVTGWIKPPRDVHVLVPEPASTLPCMVRGFADVMEEGRWDRTMLLVYPGGHSITAQVFLRGRQEGQSQ